MRRMLIAAAFLVPMLGAGTAEAAKFEFRGDSGTRCVVEVGAHASHGIQALQLPRVGFSAVPVCTYAPRAAGGPTGKAGGQDKRKSRACGVKRKAKGKARKRGCGKGRKKQGAPKRRPYAAASVQPAVLRQAQLFLLGAGTALPGDQTLASLGAGGYTCSLLPAASCSDQGNLSPAVPQAPYQARYEVTLAPPPGERWISVPAGCSAAAAPVCTLFSPGVVPLVL